jgi:DNA polymerase-3 subunit epsilon
MGLDHSTFWVVDVEGNGGTPPEIVELAMVQVAEGEVTPKQRHYFIRPENPISPHVTRIHGITNEDVAGAPTFSDIADDLLGWLEGAAIVGHNVKVEVDILARSLDGWAPAMAIDTLRLSRLVLPHLTSHSLESVGEALGRTAEARRRSGQGHHAALFDATLTALVFIDLAARARDAGRPDLVREADILGSSQGRLL